MSKNKVLDAALEYAKRGWSVIPVHSHTKLPAVRWADYQNRIADESTIRAWWKEFPSANVAIVTGRISNLFVVDVDPAKGGEAAPILDFAPTGLVAATGGGGYHLAYAYPDDGEPVGNRAGLTPGVDVRGDGGYIVAPPSIHASGRRYEWGTYDAPGVMPVATLATIRTPARRNADITDNWITQLITEGAPVGERNDAAARLAGYYLGKGIPEDATLALLAEWNASKNDPPLAAKELERTVGSVSQTAGRRKSRDAGRVRVQFEEMGSEVEAQAVPRFAVVPLASYMVEHGQHRVEWTIDGWLPRDTIAFMVAAPESYKTWILLDCAVSVASGAKFLDQFEVNQSGPVLIIQQEDSHGGLAQRLGAIIHSRLNLGVAEEDGGFTVRTPPDLPIYIHPDRNLRFEDEGVMDELERVIAEIKPRLVLIDPLYAAAQQDDFMAKAIPHMFRLKQMRDTYGVSFILAHHTKKGVDPASTAREGLWGSQFLNAFLETGWQIRRGDSPNVVTVRRHFKVTESKTETYLQFDIKTDFPPFQYKVSTTENADVGGTGVDIINLLLKDGPMTADEISAATGTHVTTIRKRMKALLADTMVVKSRDNKYSVVPQPTGF
jgi:hypothetical protein